MTLKAWSISRLGRLSGSSALYGLMGIALKPGYKAKETEQIFISSFDPETVGRLHAVLNDEFYVSKDKSLSQHEDLFIKGCTMKPVPELPQ